MLTKKQIQAKRRAAMEEEARVRKLQKELAPRRHVELKAEIPKLDGDGRCAEGKNLKSAAQIIREAELTFVPHDHAQREAVAQKEIEKKKKRVAPLFNKGGLQYISDDTDLTTLGRKV